MVINIYSRPGRYFTLNYYPNLRIAKKSKNFAVHSPGKFITLVPVLCPEYERPCSKNFVIEESSAKIECKLRIVAWPFESGIAVLYTCRQPGTFPLKRIRNPHGIRICYIITIYATGNSQTAAVVKRNIHFRLPETQRLRDLTENLAALKEMSLFPRYLFP